MKETHGMMYSSVMTKEQVRDVKNTVTIDRVLSHWCNDRYAKALQMIYSDWQMMCQHLQGVTVEHQIEYLVGKGWPVDAELKVWLEKRVLPQTCPGCLRVANDWSRRVATYQQWIDALLSGIRDLAREMEEFGQDETTR